MQELSLKELHIFPKLPYDIQYEIWKHASYMVKPRVVEIFFDQGKGRFGTSAPCPVLLHVCKGAREFMLRRWVLCFDVGESEARNHGGPYGESVARIPFNFDIDTLCFDKSFINVGCLVKLEDRKRIVRVAWAFGDSAYDMSRILVHDDEWALKRAAQLVDLFPNLETLKIAFGRQDNRWCYWENMGCYWWSTNADRSYTNHWGLDVNADEAMLPHYLYLNDLDTYTDTPFDRWHYDALFRSLSFRHPDLRESWPKVSFAVGDVKLIGVEQDPWGYDDCTEKEEEKRMRAKKAAFEKRLEEMRQELANQFSVDNKPWTPFEDLSQEYKALTKRLRLLTYLDYEDESDKKARIHVKNKSIVQHLHEMKCRRIWERRTGIKWR